MNELDGTAGGLVAANVAVYGRGGATPLSTSSKTRGFRAKEPETIVIDWPPSLVKLRVSSDASSGDVAEGGLHEFDANAGASIAADGEVNGGGGATPLSTSSKTRAFRSRDSAEIDKDLPPPLAKPE